MRVRMVSLVSVLVLSAATGRSQAPQYVIHDVGGDTESLRVAVRGINQNGQVVGSTLSGGGQRLGFRTKPNSPIDLPADYLGTLGGTSSEAFGINGSGQVVGSSQTASGATHGFRTAPNALINPTTDDIGTLGGPDSSCRAINDSGQVVGQSTTSAGQAHAFRTSPNAAINPATDDLGMLPFTPDPTNGWSEATSINSSGHVAGVYLPAGPNPYYPTAFFYKDGAITEIPQFLDTPLASKTSPVNDSDQIADTISGISGYYLGLWQSGTIIPLAACSCVPSGLNNSPQVVGTTYYLPPYPFLYTNASVYDLNALIPPGSGWVLTDAVAINDEGQIIGYGQLNGVKHAFRLDPVPAIQLSPSSLNFGPQAVGITSAPQFVTVTNTGATPLIFTRDTVSGDFGLAGLGSCGLSLAPGTSCTISIHFTPTAPGTRTGILTIPDNAPDSPQTVRLTGTGGRSQPAVSLSPTSLNFTAQTIGTTSPAQFVTVTNTGGAPLTFTLDTVSGDFALAGLGSCGLSLAPGTSCTISIHFTPTAPGTRTGILTIPDNAPDSPQMVSLTGIGGQFQPAVDLIPAVLYFAPQAVGTTSPAQFVTVTNYGNAPLTFTLDTVSGDFALAGLGTCGPSLVPGANCTISIHFTPIGTGTRTGALTIPDNAPNSPQVVALSGIGR